MRLRGSDRKGLILDDFGPRKIIFQRKERSYEKKGFWDIKDGVQIFEVLGEGGVCLPNKFFDCRTKV